MDTCRSNKSFHTQGHLNKSSRIHAANSNKFARNLSGYLSTFVRKDPSGTFCHSHWPWNTSSHMDHANKFSRNHWAIIDRLIHCHLTLIGRPIHYHFCHRQRSSTMNQRQSIKSTT